MTAIRSPSTRKQPVARLGRGFTLAEILVALALMALGSVGRSARRVGQREQREQRDRAGAAWAELSRDHFAPTAACVRDAASLLRFCAWTVRSMR